MNSVRLWLAVGLVVVAASLTLAAPGLAVTTFRDDFSGSVLSGAVWDTSVATSGKRLCPDNIDSRTGTWVDVSATACSGVTASSPYGSITVGDGVAGVRAPSGSVFPYAVAGPPSRRPFPAAGDFVFTARMRFDALAGFGAGLQLTAAANAAPTGSHPLGPTILALWNGNASLPGIDVAIPDPSSFHDFRLQYTGGAYSLYIDGTLAIGPVASTLRPTTIWFGNPIAVFWGASDWTAFTLDSIWVARARRCSSSERPH